MTKTTLRWIVCIFCSVAPLLGLVRTASAQVLEAFDDRYAIPKGFPLDVEPFGVLDNDRLDGENAGESGATAVLVTDVSYGTLTFNSDGSFFYRKGAGFDGTDQFVYRAEFGAASAEATVILSACDIGPDLINCWNETAFLAEIQALGYSTFPEGFEDDAVWGQVRYPQSAPSVLSQGIAWRTNHPDPPPMNPISTTPGPPHSGQWAIFDRDHGYSTGEVVECDIDNPPEHCLYYDGFSGTIESGLGPLRAVGGYFSGTYAANVVVLLDSGAPIEGVRLTAPGHTYFGVIDTRPAGFTHFEFREIDGKVGQAKYIFGDDFTLVTDAATSVPESAPAASTGVSRLHVSPNPTSGDTIVRFDLQSATHLQLAIYDVRGRLVRPLIDGFRELGSYAVEWDKRDTNGLEVTSGIYFARLIVDGSGVESAAVRKIVVTE